MSESEAHKRAKRRAAGKSGRTECPVPSGRLDACTPGRAYEVERSGNHDRLRHSAKKLQESGRRQRVLVVPNHHLSKAAKAMKAEGVSGTVRNISGTRRLSVRKKRKK